MNVFLSTIPLNLYALLTILTVVYFSFSKYEIGSMESYERDDTSRIVTKEEVGYTHSDKGRVIDLILPIVVLISVTILMMMRTGGF